LGEEATYRERVDVIGNKAFIEFVEQSTIKEIKTQAEYCLKQYKKLMKLFYTEFSKQERHRANTCKEGTATKMLSELVFEYLQKPDNDLRTIEELITIRPSTKTLLKGHYGAAFKTSKPLFSSEFAVKIGATSFTFKAA
jgi:hypothetical protein